MYTAGVTTRVVEVTARDIIDASLIRSPPARNSADLGPKSLRTQLVPHGYCVESNLFRLYTRVSVPYCHTYLLRTYTFQRSAMCQSKNSSTGWHKK